jgi:ABC-type sugar transport system substrate-binding protein
MRFTKLFILALSAAALAVPAATAAPAKGKPGRSGPDCRPRVMVVLKGTVAAQPAATDTSFQLKVDRANHHGRALGGQTLTMNVDANTRYVKGDQKIQLKDLAANDRVLVQARACKADLKAARDAQTLPSLTARKVVVKPAHAPVPADAEQSSEHS